MHDNIRHFEVYLLTERCLAKNTVEAYCNDMMQLLLFFEKNECTLQTVNDGMLKKFLRFLKEERMSARTMARKISALKSFYKWAHIRYGWNNIASDLVVPKLEKKLPQYLSEDDIEKLFQAAEKDTSEIGIRNKIMLALLYVSGMRISELTHVMLDDIHFDTGFVHIRGKGGKERRVPLPQSMRTILKEYIETVHMNFIHKHGQKTGYLFPVLYSGALKPITRQSFWLILKKLCILSGINASISPHTLRHSLATHLLKKGAHLRSLQLLLGHENLATVEIYTHVETGYLRKIYDKKHPRA